MKKALVVVDFQNDFVNGSLGFKGAEALDSIIAEKVREAFKTGVYVIFTLDTHKSDYLLTHEGKILNIPHCIEGTEGWMIFGETGVLASKMKTDEGQMLQKGQFGSLELARILSDKHCEEVELCGLVSNICVVSNALITRAALPEAKITVDSKATASFDEQAHQAALSVMRSCQIEVL